jgi:kynurenine formamidase
MRKSTFLAILVVCAFVVSISAAPALAKRAASWPDKWWPSKWGPGDEKGSFNTITPAKVKAAMRLVKRGKIYRTGMTYWQGMPLFGKRTYALHIPGLPLGGPLGTNKIVWNDEFICGELGQIGTQFDGPGHVGIMCEDGVPRWYNGAELATMEHVYGFKVNGVEKLGPCVTRGVLIDMVGLKGRGLNKGEVIYPKDIERCIKKAGIAPIGEGDAVIFHTGWGRYWNDPPTFNAGCPGIGVDAAEYLIAKNPSMLCSDTWPIEVIPGEDPDRPFQVHCLMQPVNGVWFLENLSSEVLSQMASEGVYEFLWIYIPVQFGGATGSPGEGIAIR